MSYSAEKARAYRKRNRGGSKGRRANKLDNVVAIDGEGRNDPIDLVALFAHMSHLLDAWEELENVSQRFSAHRDVMADPRRRQRGAQTGRRAQYVDLARSAGRSRAPSPERTAIRAAENRCETIMGDIYACLAATHHYTLLCDSSGRVLRGDSLSTRECLDWLLAIGPRALCVGFSVSYDVNMLLRDLPARKLATLHKTGRVWWHEYCISWHAGKRFTVARGRERVAVARRTGRLGSRMVWRERCVIHDVFGFFQSSFVTALGAWDIGRLDVRERIASMKAQRGSFALLSEQSVEDYCFAECALLVELVTKLIDTTRSVGIRLESYHGAGAGAAAWLKKHRIREHLAPPPRAVHEAAMRAYFGGWFEVSAIGPIEGRVYVDDINSAYPAQIAGLPCLAHGVWIKSRRVTDWGVYRVRWELPGFSVWGCLPFRFPDGSVCRPSAGEGWYWGAEVAAAQRMYPGRVRVSEGWVYVTECDCVPFAAVVTDYARRAELKAAGDHGALVLKLILNSLYGKMAQTLGAEDRKPPYQSFVWAGMVTAGCRAQILDAISQAPDDVLSIATDGIISRSRLDLERGEGLGQWESVEASQLFLAQNGVYTYRYETGPKAGQTKVASRGFSGREIVWDEVREVFRTERELGVWEKRVQRFVGMGSALARVPTLYGWRRWTWQRKSVAFAPTNRVFLSEVRVAEPARGELRTLCWPAVEGMSAPRVLAADWPGLWADEQVLEDVEQPA